MPTDTEIAVLAIVCGLILTLGSTILWRPGLILDEWLYGEKRRQLIHGTVSWKIYRAGRWAMFQRWYRPANFAAGIVLLLLASKLLGWL